MTFRVVDEVPVDPSGWRVYAEGWQSWSPTTWYSAGQEPHLPAEPWQHTMRFRPGSPLPGEGIQAEGLLVLDPGIGAPARRYAGLDASHEVASVRVHSTGDYLVVSANAEIDVATDSAGPVRALTTFGDALAASAGLLRTAPSAWCSWYCYFETVTSVDIEENISALDEHEIPVDVVQIDDGWSHGLGEWLRPAQGFGKLPALVDRIRSGARQAGIWLAPFLVGRDTDVARLHPDWLVGDAGRNWGQDLVGLDLTHPGVRDYLSSALRSLREAGFTYFKLDFLYAGAVPGTRREDISEVAAYRSGLRLVRDAVGPEAFLLGCGAPILPSVGFFDAMRVSPDTYHEGGTDGSEGLRGRMSLVARAWQQGRLWTNDPDCLVTNPTYRLRERWAETVHSYGGMRSFSDRVARLDAWGLDTTRRLMADRPEPTPFTDDLLTEQLAKPAADLRGDS